MSKIEFRFYLAGASIQALHFAKNFVTNFLPTEFKYNVELSGYSGVPKEDRWDFYPEDKDVIKYGLTESEVVELLYRNNKVPVWIDINVNGVNKTETIFDLCCSGQYSSEKEDYYYNHNGSGPFGVKSPVLPPGYKEGQKFKI